MTTKIPVELSSTPGIVDGSNATAITIDSSENVTITGDLNVTGRQINTGNTAGDHSEFGTDGSGHTFIDASTSGGAMFFQQGGATKVAIVSGKLGIGTTSPDELLELVSADPRIRLRDSTAGGASGGGGKIEFGGYHAGSSDGTRLWAEIHGLKNNGTGGDTHGDMIFKVNQGASSPAEGMRLNKDGVLAIGGTTPQNGDADPTKCLYLEGADAVMIIKQTAASSSSQRQGICFLNSSGTRVGTIAVRSNGTDYITSSDYRLKENVKPLPNGLDRLNALKPVQFDWKSDSSTSEGFLAHEVEEVFPHAVMGEKDGTAMQSMDYGRITPLLVKAIQEQQEQIEQLKTEIQTLKGE